MYEFEIDPDMPVEEVVPAEIAQAAVYEDSPHRERLLALLTQVLERMVCTEEGLVDASKLEGNQIMFTTNCEEDDPGLVVIDPRIFAEDEYTQEYYVAHSMLMCLRTTCAMVDIDPDADSAVLESWGFFPVQQEPSWW